MLPFSLLCSHKKKRVGVLKMPRATISTPELAIVATEGEIRAIPRDMWKELPNTYFIVNTYHTYTKKLIPHIEKAGGIHKYMGIQDRLIATDSGGFQVFSLGFGKRHNIGKVARESAQASHIQSQDINNPLIITEQGVTFEYDGKKLTLTPEKSMELQHQIGADIMFAFDECTSPLNSKKYTRSAMERTHRWLDRCITAHHEYKNTQALFGIVQGGEYKDLRECSARIVGSKDVVGFGIGGSFGDFKHVLGTTVGWVTAILPPEKPRHLLGIGKVMDIFAAVENGVDLFDCVIPTREARHRMVYTKRGRLYLRKLKHLDEPIDPNCRCPGCRDSISMSQLWQWFLAKDLQAATITTMHNLWFYADLMREIRESIEMGSFNKLRARYHRWYE